MVIDYSATRSFTASIDLVDPGNTCLCCKSDDETEHYLIIRTIYGMIHVLAVGPILPDVDTLLKGFSVNYDSFKWNEKKLAGVISGFLNNPKRNVVEVTELIPEEARKYIPEDFLTQFLQIA